MTRVLVVDDEPQMLRALSINLRARHYEVVTAATGAEALAGRRGPAPDIVILDLGLPDLDGVEVVRGLRGWSTAPIIILSGRSGSADKVERARRRRRRLPHQAVRRGRAAGPACEQPSRRATADDAQPVVTFGPAMVDLTARRVTFTDGDRTSEVRLTPTEWHLLEVLLRHPGKLLSQKRLLAEVWGPGYETASGQPAGLHGAAAPQARTGPEPTPAPADRTRAWATASSPAPRNIRRPDHRPKGWRWPA